MGKCNLFAPANRTTGNLFLFSQYTEDLTKSMLSEDYYRVVPSKYVLLRLNSFGGGKTDPLFDNVSFPEYLQNYYENACSLMRQDQSVGWTPDCAADMLWKTLTRCNLVYVDRVAKTSENVLYIGDINITSDKQFDGINYSEIYVEVPQDSKAQSFRFYNFSQDLTRTVTYDQNYICGYPDDEYPGTGLSLWPSNRINTSHSNVPYYDNHSNGIFSYTLRDTTDWCFVPEPLDTSEDEYYEFNCVLVLYDIHKRGVEDHEISVPYKNIPMCMYITGDIESTQGVYGSIRNKVRIWVSNDDIYQQGTSYGLRICTRYVSTQNSLYIVDSTVEDTEELYDQYSALMTRMSNVIDASNRIYNSIHEYQDGITSHLANIKNYKVNVPYIRKIGGIYYWFVNGRNLGVAVNQSDTVWRNY